MNAIWILTKLTFREAMRRRIMLAGLVLGISFLIIYSLGLHFILDQISLAIKAAATENPSVNQSISNVGKVESMNGFLMAGLYAVTFLSIAMAALLGAQIPSRERSIPVQCKPSSPNPFDAQMSFSENGSALLDYSGFTSCYWQEALY